MLKQTYALLELLAAMGFARSSCFCFYHRARLLVADRRAGARCVIADTFAQPVDTEFLDSLCEIGNDFSAKTAYLSSD
ncbi:hypothetical protein [Paraburkholderia sp. RL17-373-BIF-A]|uniref:hypothetical protein n=1 Tax=Paraburkholderia sp. RL17-373-BIF-A TaxID=3031629 RepID=UPI0038BCAF3F